MVERLIAEGLMNEQLVLEIGGLVCEIRLPQTTWYAALICRYAAFLTAAASDWQIEVRYDPTLTDGDDESIEHTGAVTQFRVAAYAGTIDLELRRDVEQFDCQLWLGGGYWRGHTYR